MTLCSQVGKVTLSENLLKKLSKSLVLIYGKLVTENCVRILNSHSWYGTGFDEVGKDILTSEVRISVNQRFYRPRDVEFLNGSSTKAEKAFGWKREFDFKTLVRQMVETDIELALTGKLDLEVPSYESIA